RMSDTGLDAHHESGIRHPFTRRSCVSDLEQDTTILFPFLLSGQGGCKTPRPDKKRFILVFSKAGASLANASWFEYAGTWKQAIAFISYSLTLLLSYPLTTFASCNRIVKLPLVSSSSPC
ncbi:MAG: hypothetical protein WBP41_02680, partial [Saprospiraceae bacterium]